MLDFSSSSLVSKSRSRSGERLLPLLSVASVKLLRSGEDYKGKGFLRSSSSIADVVEGGRRVAPEKGIISESVLIGAEA